MSAETVQGNVPSPQRAPLDAGAPAAVPTPPAPTPAPARLRELHPGWFAAVMGTAILAVATFENPGNLAALSSAAHAVGRVLAVLAYCLGVVLAAAYAARWIRHAGAAVTDLRHPVLGAMHATLPGGLLVLAVMTSVVGPSLLPARVVVVVTAALAVTGSVLAFAISVAFTYLLFTGGPPAAAVNGGWFIPPVVTVIIPIAYAPLISGASGGAARLLLALGYAAYGMGFLLFVLVMGMVYSRLVLHPLPPAVLAPTLWIALGPIGVCALAPVALARAGRGAVGAAAGSISTVSEIFATAVWGFGLWWIALAIALLVHYLRAGGLPFHVGWWAFTFPLGAYTVATVTLARAWQLPALDALAALLYVMLLGFWLLVAVRTIAATRTGQIWQR